MVILTLLSKSVNLKSCSVMVWNRCLSSMVKKVDIQVTPVEALLDNSPKIRVDGLKKDQPVTLWNTFTDDIGLVFSSHAHYVADKDGVVDVQNQMSQGGKYTGLFPEGLVCTLHTAPPVYKEKEKLKWARLYKRDVEEPMKYTLKVIDGHVSESELYSESPPEPMGEKLFLRHLMGPGVQRTEVDHDKFKGVLFTPPGDGPFPVVLDLFGAESGIKEFRSAMLASYGFAAFVAPFYNYKDLPKMTDKLHLEYFLNAIEYLDSMPRAASGGIGVVGSSKGGEIALTLAGLTNKIKAVVTINCYHRSVDISFYLNNEVYLRGYVGSATSAEVHFNEEGHLVAFGTENLYTWDLEEIIPVQKIPEDCQVLIASSDEDGGHAHRSAIAMKERARHFEKKNINAVVYPGSGHLLDPPFHSHISAVWNSVIQIRQPDGSKFSGLPHHYGGSPYAMCQATKDLWRRTLDLFHRRLVQQKGLPLDTARFRPAY